MVHTAQPVTLTLTPTQAQLVRDAAEILHGYLARVVTAAERGADPDPARAEEARAERRGLDEILATLDAAEGRPPARPEVKGEPGPSRFAGLL